MVKEDYGRKSSDGASSQYCGRCTRSWSERALGTWEDEQFRPEEVATRLKPIEFGIGEGG